MYNKLISKRAKKLISVAVASALVVTAIPAFEAEAATAKNTLSATSKTLAVGKTYTLTVKNKTKGAKVTYKMSKKTKVATVSSKGKIKAKKKGTAYVVVTVKKGKTVYKSKKCKVKVITGAKSVKINQKAFTLYVKGTKKLTVTMKNKGHGDKVTWSSNKKTVATVSTVGKVTAKKAGTATITAKTISGKKATVKVTVKNKIVPPTQKPVTPEPVTPLPVTPDPASPTPVVTGATATPVVTGPTATPVITDPTATPVVTGATATPVVTGATATPVVTGATATPVVTATPDPFVATSGTLTVKVVEGVSHTAVTGVTVSVKVATEGGVTVATAASTASGNVFTLENGKYVIVAEKEGYQVATAAAVVNGTDTEQTIILEKEDVIPVFPTSAEVTVNITNATGAAVTGATIVVLKYGELFQVATGATFELKNGDYILLVQAQGYDIALSKVIHVTGSVQTVDVQLEIAKVESVVFGVELATSSALDANAVSGVAITIKSVVGEVEIATTSATSAVMFQLPIGAYIIELKAEGYVSQKFVDIIETDKIVTYQIDEVKK